MKAVRAGWVLGFFVSVGILLGSLPGYWARLNQIPFSYEFYSVQQEAPWLGAPVSLASAVLCIALAGLLFLKKPNERMALFLSFYLLLYGIIVAGPLEAFLPFWFPSLGDLAYEVQGVVFGITLALILVFPNGRFLPRWTRWIVVVALLELTVAFFALRDPSEMYRINSPASQLLYALLGVLFLLALGVQFYRYRKFYTPHERQQTKWVLYGFVLWLVMLGLVSIPYYYWQNLPPGTPAPWWLPLGSVAWQLSVSILPLAFTIAILRSHLWDIDVIFRRTVTYALLAALLAVIYFGSVILLQQLFAGITGQRSEIITVLSTLAIAALFVPLRNRLQDVIDKRFNRKKYDAQQVLQKFGETVRDETDLEQLTGRLIEVVNDTMQPKSVSLWLKRDEVRARGSHEG